MRLEAGGTGYLCPISRCFIVWFAAPYKKYWYVVEYGIRIRDGKRPRSFAYSAQITINPRPHDGYCMGQLCQHHGKCAVYIHNPQSTHPLFPCLADWKSFPPLPVLHLLRNDIGVRKLRIGQCNDCAKLCKNMQTRRKTRRCTARYYNTYSRLFTLGSHWFALPSRPIMPYETGQALTGHYPGTTKVLRHTSHLQAAMRKSML